VRRGGVQRYLMLTLLSFAASVAGTRLFLEITGYPQIGTSELHIAHVLWGGLLLFIAALVPLIYANRWAYDAGAVLAGAGVGLFIDEVGKFITQTNDYFHPAAAPIIYAFFLLTVLLYFRVRRPISRDSRAELYRALGGIEEVLDHDLQPRERQRLQARLLQIAQDEQQPDFARLAAQLAEFLDSENLRLAPDRMSRFERGMNWILAMEERWLPKTMHRTVLTGGLLGLGTLSLLRVALLATKIQNSWPMLEGVVEFVTAGRITGRLAASVVSTEAALEGIVGIMLVLGTVLLWRGRERLGTGMAHLGLLIQLAIVNLLTFYIEQFSTIVNATVQFIVLVGVIRYRQRYLS
jgi:hypothetical protein